MAKKITYNQLKSMSATEISKLNKQQAAEMLKQFREKFRYREKAFQRAGKNVYSPALEKMDEYYQRNGVQSPDSMNVNKIRSELFHIQEFFNSDTADVKGARKVMREQDARIFGVNERGTPKYRMTIEERTKFWETYNEFVNTFKNYESIYGSDRIQQFLGEITMSGRKEKGIFKKGEIGLMQTMSKLQKKLREDAQGEDWRASRNVLTGRWPV